MTSLQRHLNIQFLVYSILIVILMMPLFYLVTVYHFGEEMLELEKSIRLGLPINRHDIFEDIREGLFYIYLLIFLALLLSIFVMQLFVSKKAMKPFYNTLDAIKRYSIEKEESISLQTTHIHEFHELNQIVEEFVKESRLSLQKQKELITAISHEYQTPLAILQVKLDKVLEEDELTPDMVEEIEQLYDVITRSRKMNQNLLLLARVENRQYEIDEEIFVMDFLKKKVLPNLQMVYPDCQIEVKYSSDICVKANSSLLMSAMINLVVNAIRHSSDQHEVTIQLQGRSFQVVNFCSPDCVLDKEQLFTRFYKPKHSKGHGLGLSIVKSICLFHGWDIDYKCVNNRHIFEINF